MIVALRVFMMTILKYEQFIIEDKTTVSLKSSIDNKLIAI